MKKSLLTLFAALAGFGATRAADTARLFASNLGNGLTESSGTTAVASGTIRFGTFPPGFDFAANSENFAALDAAFTDVFSLSGPIAALAANGFFDIQHTFATNGSYEGVAYDGSAGSTADVAGDIANEPIYVWILNNTTPSAATQQAVFSTSQTWPDKNFLVTDVTVSTDTGTAGLAVHLGSLATGADIGAGAPSHSMGGATEPVANVIASRLPDTTVVAGQMVTFSYTAEGTPPFTQQWRKDGLPIAGATGATYVIASSAVTDDGSYDVVVSNGANSLDSNDLSLDVVTAIPEITDEPDPVIVNAGGTIELEVAVTGQAPFAFKWFKGSAAIKNANAAKLTIPNASLKDAGDFSCEVTNAAGKDTSVKAQVVVVADIAKNLVLREGTAATMAVVFAGPGASLQWFKGVDPVAEAIGKTLLIKPLAVADSGLYTCQVTLNGQTAIGGTHQLSVFDAAPILGEVVLPEGIVGGLYAPGQDPAGYAIPLAGTVANAATGFTATPLPPGLKLDNKLGRIFGTPTKAGEFNVKITAMNAAGKSASVTVALTIRAFPINLAGNYVGRIQRAAVLGGDLGGRIEFMVSPTGRVTGKLLIGTSSFPIAGALDVPLQTPDAPVAVPAVLKIKRKGLSDLTVGFELGGAVAGGENLLLNGYITDGTANELNFNGWRNVWSTANPAGAYLGQYNLAMGLDEGDPNVDDEAVPQGLGFASFTVARDGKFSFTGKTADKEGVTGATFIGPNGQAFIFLPLYKTVQKGSIVGDFVIDDLNNADPADNTLLGAASWTRPANSLPAHRLYRAGFGVDVDGPIELVIRGGSYRDPKPNLVLGLQPGDAAAFEFVNGGIQFASEVAPDTTLNAELTVHAGNKIKVTGDNPAALKFTVVNAAKGAFAGSLTLLDDNPLTPANNGSEIKRTTAFEGLLVPMDGEWIGAGFGLVEQLPVGAGDTPKNTPILSGAAFLRVP